LSEIGQVVAAAARWTHAVSDEAELVLRERPVDLVGDPGYL